MNINEKLVALWKSVSYQAAWETVYADTVQTQLAELLELLVEERGLKDDNTE